MGAAVHVYSSGVRYRDERNLPIELPHRTGCKPATRMEDRLELAIPSDRRLLFCLDFEWTLQDY
jgi:hypothetical protein